MRLFVYDKSSHKKVKIYLDIDVPSRISLANRWGNVIKVRGNQYHVSEVYAEPKTDPTIAGTVAGGLIGALAGPAGILIGGGLGTLLGSGAQSEEIKKVNTFNRSTTY